MSNNTSDKIKNRLLKNASQLWGVQQAELSAFDPVVSMLFGSCSKEFENGYNEQDSSQARVLSFRINSELAMVTNGCFIRDPHF